MMNLQNNKSLFFKIIFSVCIVAISFIAFWLLPASNGQNELLNVLSNFVSSIYLAPRSLIIRTIPFLPNDSGFSYYIVYILTMFCGFSIFISLFTILNLIPLKLRNFLNSKIWLFCGNLIISQIEFLISILHGYRHLKPGSMIAISAIGFLTADLPTTMSFLNHSSLSIFSIIIYKLAAILLVTQWFPIHTTPATSFNFEWRQLLIGFKLTLFCCLGIALTYPLILGLNFLVDLNHFEVVSGWSKPLFYQINNFINTELSTLKRIQQETELLPSQINILSMTCINFINLVALGFQIGAIYTFSQRNFLFAIAISSYGLGLAILTQTFLYFPLWIYYATLST